jgi:hypothetical protein
MKSKTYNGAVRSSEKVFETLQLGAFRYSRFVRSRGRRLNWGIRAEATNTRAGILYLLLRKFPEGACERGCQGEIFEQCFGQFPRLNFPQFHLAQVAQRL